MVLLGFLPVLLLTCHRCIWLPGMGVVVEGIAFTLTCGATVTQKA